MRASCFKPGAANLRSVLLWVEMGIWMWWSLICIYRSGVFFFLLFMLRHVKRKNLSHHSGAAAGCIQLAIEKETRRKRMWRTSASLCCWSLPHFPQNSLRSPLLKKKQELLSHVSFLQSPALLRWGFGFIMACWDWEAATMIGGLFIYNHKGEVLISRVYRDDIGYVSQERCCNAA